MIRRNAITSLVCLVLLAPNAFGQETEKPAAGQDKLDKKVLDIVKQTGDLYKNAKSMHVEGTILGELSNDAGIEKTNTTAVYDVEKPNHFSVRTKSDGDAKKGPDIIADGKNLIVFRKALNQYTEQAAPKSLGEIGLTLLRLGANNAGMLFANILADDPAQLLMDGVTSCTYAGTDKVDGVPVHRMKFVQPQFDWELWVAAEGKPYILRMISVQNGPEGKLTTTETYKNWKLDGTPAEGAFKFEAPKDATKVDRFPRQQ
jgi:hypothetical protein